MEKQAELKNPYTEEQAGTEISVLPVLIRFNYKPSL
jgi:hypothetical protein